MTSLATSIGFSGAATTTTAGGAIGGALGMGPNGLNLFGGPSKSIGSFGVGFLRRATSSIITQGIGVAAGLQ